MRIVWAVMCMLVCMSCHVSYPRMARQGRYDELVRAAAHTRIPPRREAARAWATALAHLGRVDEARGVLLRDFRRGGHTKSLLALAELEMRHGLMGVALVHWERLISLERGYAHARGDVCAGFRARARAFLELDQAAAALHDLALADELCQPGPAIDDLARVRSHAAAQARTEVQARSDFSNRCGRKGCKPVARERQLARLRDSLAQARASGAKRLRETAQHWQTELPAQDVATLLSAEGSGQLGLDLVSDDEIRAWVGAQALEPLIAALGNTPAGVADYVSLRLERARRLPRQATAPEQDSRSRFVTGALEGSGIPTSEQAGESWRVLAVMGDLAGAEVSLSTSLRARPRARASLQTRIAKADLWLADVELDSRTLLQALVLARLRAAAGQPELGLSIARYVLAEAQAAGIEVARELGVSEARRHLQLGEPWSALALVDALAHPLADAVRAAAGTHITMLRIACGEACDGDRGVVERMLGETWLRHEEQRAGKLAISHAFALPSATPCPSLAHHLRTEQDDPLRDAVLAGLAGAATPGLADKLARAIESDPTLICAGEIATAPLLAKPHRLVASALVERLAHAGSTRSWKRRLVEAELALAAGHSMQARLLAQSAAALAERAADVWARWAMAAHTTGDRETTLDALRELVLHSRDLDHRRAKHQLVTTTLQQADDAVFVRGHEIGRASLRRTVEEHLAAMPEPQRWAELDQLAWDLGRHAWADGYARAIVHELVLPGKDVQARHENASAVLLESDRWRFDERRDFMANDAVTVAAQRGLVRALPKVVTAVGDLDAFERARLAIVSGGHAELEIRQGMAVALVVTGSLHARAIAASLLVRTSTRQQQHGLVRYLLQAPAALTRGAPTVVIEDPRVLARVVFGLAQEPG